MHKKLNIITLLFIAITCGEAAVIFTGYGSTLYENHYLAPGLQLYSQAGYSARMQHDGNFVIYDNRDGSAIWATGTFGTSGRKLIMQDDGNLVLYDRFNAAIWSSQSFGRGQSPYKLVMQQDRNLVIYDANNNPIWNTNTQV